LKLGIRETPKQLPSIHNPAIVGCTNYNIRNPDAEANLKFCQLFQLLETFDGAYYMKRSVEISGGILTMITLIYSSSSFSG